MKFPFPILGASLFHALLLLIPLAAPLAADDKSSAPTLHALLLTGEGSHDWRGNETFLRQLLVETGRFDVRICESPVGISKETLKPYDLIVDDYDGPRWGHETEEALEGFVAGGKGLVVTNAALTAFKGKEEWRDFAEITHTVWNNYNVGKFRIFPVQLKPTDLPIVKGLREDFHTGDQLYEGLSVQPAAAMLATSDKDEPLIWVSGYGAGRVFCTALGHDLGSMQEKAFITTFLRGAEWAASNQVTIPAEIGMPGPNPNSLRVLVVAGGHDHETSFYGLFDGYKDLGWVAVSDSKLAFEKDIRSKYDVIVMYDFTRDMEDKEKQNLRDFVESNKGIVVLHHGILDYQKWPWWYEEVVGGRYRLQAEGDIPSSSVKFGQEHLITPVENHPITAGIAPFHVTDETYRGLFISPKITPLLTTTNRTSDSVVGWIGPCTTSRVVFIQLGHDHSPFRHPSYRALVHNSILWTAGRLP